VARVALLSSDLLFGSKVQGALRRAGHEPVAFGEPAEVLIVDLTDQVEARLEAVADARLPTLAFYAHVDRRTRALAEEAGVELVVPRSRMAREGAALVDSLL
jgi:hypothetical protein